MPELSLFVLGIPRIERDGRAVEVERHKALALLAYLAVTGAPHRRDGLAALLWPELDQSRARAALRRTLSTLNLALAGDWLEADRETIGLRASSTLWLDVAQFQSLLAQCRRHGHPQSEACAECLAPLTEAVRLYRGDFLSGFSLRDAPGFDEWQFFQAETLRRDLASALERLTHGHSARREFDAAIGYARRWLALDPLHELAQCQLMRLYVWAGQRNAALRQYAECVRLLERELGVPPQAATTELYTVIKENRLLSKQPEDRPASAAKDRAVPESMRRPAAVPPTPTAASSTLDRIVRGQLVGRERELAEARIVWSRAVSGESQVLLVSGEPGIGKTRLVHELVNLAQAAGARVLADACHAEGGPPYAPLAGMMRAAFESSPDPDLPEFILEDLLTLAPHLRPHHPHISPNPTLDPQFERQRVFDSFVAWCERLAAHTPLLLLVEDVHWADGGTLALLRHLARRARHARLLLVLTYRDTEVELERAHPLNPVLLDLNRERLEVQIKLTRLSREHTRDLLAAMLSTAGDITPDFLDGLYRETEGNPFFIEEVCKGLIEQGKLYHAGGTWRRADMQAIFIPPSVRGAIMARVEHLPGPAQDVLRVAAILGREFDFDVLNSASEQDEDALVAALERAERAQLIGKSPHAGRTAFVFAHALIPFALRESLSSLRRQRLHRRAASVIEAQRPNDWEALAYHFAAAGERDKAVEYSRRAAERAEALFAYDAAIEHLQIALDLIETGEQDETRLALLESQADVHRLRGERAEAILIYQQALGLWPGLANADKWIAARLHRKIGETFLRLKSHANLERFEAIAQSSLESALRLIEGERPHPESVRLLTTLANDRWNARSRQDWEAAERYARAAAAMGEKLDAPVELSAALGALDTVYGARGLYRERVQLSEQRLALSRDPRFGDVRERINLLSQTGNALSFVGEYAQALPHLLEAERLADQIRDVNQHVYALGLQAQCFFGLDRWDEMLQIETRRLALEQRYGRDRVDRMCFYCGLSANVLALRGQFDQSHARRDEAHSTMTGYWGGPPEMWAPVGHY